MLELITKIEQSDSGIRLLRLYGKVPSPLLHLHRSVAFFPSYSHLCFTFIAHSTIFEFIRLQIFTGVFPRHYDPPDGFVFEINDVSPPIQVSLAKEFTFMHCLNYDTLEHHFHMENLIEG